MQKRIRLIFRFLLFLILLRSGLAADRDLKALINDLLVIPAVTGNEELLAAKIRERLPKSFAVETDNLSSVYARAGKGNDAIGVFAALDEFGWFVSGITADGYLRLDRSAVLPHPLFDSFLLGHAVVISTGAGLQNGVVAQPAMHLLSRERREELQKGISLDMVYVDIGAGSEQEVAFRGVEHLDSVSFRPELVTLANDQLAGSSLGHKAICSALAAAAGEVGRMRDVSAVHFAWMAQSRFAARGAGGRVSLGALRAARRLQPKTVLLLDGLAADLGENSPILGKGPVLWQLREARSKLKETLVSAAREKNIALQHKTGGESTLLASFQGEGVDAVVLALPVKFSQTPSEVISLPDVRAMVDLVISVAVRGGAR
ncbi:MAG: hypothetical protein AB1715_04350 [Acidobacteriota bacterium]